jgi:hypothetical protein
MSALVHRKIKLLLVFISVLAMTVLLISSCWLPHYVTDPHAKTPGYRLYTGRTEGLSVSLEYPDTWKRLSNEKYDTFELVRLDNENSDSIDISSDLNAAQGGEYESAHALLQYCLNRDGGLLEFRLISQGLVMLGEVEGEELSYSWRFKAKEVDIDKVVIQKYVVVDYEGRVYSVSLFVDADKYEGIKEGFEHLLATFRFLE